VQVNTCPCAVVPQASFTAPSYGLYTVTVEFPGTCFEDYCPVSVLVTDADDCKVTLDFLSGIDDPCNELTADVVGSGLSFSAAVSGGSGAYNYSWSFNPNFFTPLGPINGPNLLLEKAFEPAGPNPPAQTITLMVTDSNDCVTFASRVVTFCAPTALDTGQINPIPCFQQGYISLFAQPCLKSGPFVDWGTFQVVKVLNAQGQEVINKIRLVPITGNSNNFIIIYDTDDLDLLAFGGEFMVYWRVADTAGVWSNNAILNVTVLPCREAGKPSPGTNDCTCNYRTTCTEQEDSRGISFEFDLTNCFKKCDCLDPDKEVNIESFRIVSGPFIAGAYVIFDPATLKLRYSAPAGSEGVDLIEYVICSESGNCSGISTATIYLNCIDIPELVDDVACTNCGLPVTINVLNNDSGENLDPSSLTIITPPSFGLVYIDGNYNVVYTPFTSFSGVDTFTYTVTNYGGQGGFPEPATVTINVSCAGEGEEITICEPSPFPVATVDSMLTCTNDINKALYNIVLGSFIDYANTPQALDNGDILRIESSGLGLSVELIVGQNPLLGAGYQNDVGGNWAALISYMTATTMTPSALLAGNYIIQFDKKAWADTNGYHNIYDLTTGNITQNQALQFDIDVYCVDVSTGQQSAQVTTVIKKVKLNAFEDNAKSGFARKGGGAWSSADGAQPTLGCTGNCVASPVESWYSQIQGGCGVPKLTLPPSVMTSYKKSGESQVNLSPGVPLTLASAENDVINAINSFGPWSFKYVPCGSAALATYGVGGYSSTIAVSCYLEEDAQYLETFEITYENDTTNDGKTAKMTLDSVILF